MDIKAIEEAVVLFYQSGSQQQQGTHEWLTHIQASPQAWSFCWQLMQKEKSSEVQFFGAITLHSKLAKHWSEIPNDAYGEFKQKLLETIVLFGNGPKIVLSRLSISLSAFIVHMFDQPTVIEDVINMFTNQQLGNLSKNTQIEILLEVLENIPDEADTIHILIPRSAIREELNKKATMVINTILQLIKEKLTSGITSTDLPSLLNGSKCISSWFKYGNIRLDECEPVIQVLLNLVHFCYWTSKNDDDCVPLEESELAESCIKTLNKILTSQSQVGSYGVKYPNTVLRFVELFLEVLCPILDAEWKENNENENLAYVIYGLFLSTLECYSSTIFSGIVTDNVKLHEIYKKIVDVLMKCTNKPGTYPVEESCSSLSMEFWYMLQEEVFSIDNAEQKRKCLEAIRPIYVHLVKILIKKSQIPDDSSKEKWNSDDLETFRCYRQDISDTLLSCHDVLHDLMLDVLIDCLNESLAQLNYNNWIYLESTIHAFCAIAQKIEYTEYPQVVKLLNVLNEIPYDKFNSKLLGMSLETVGAFSDWICDNPKYLPAAIDLLVKGLNSTQASQATLSLKDMTTECQKDLTPYAIPLLDACQASLNSSHLKNTERIRLMYSIGNILSVVPPERILPYLDVIVSPCFEELQNLVQTCDKTESARLRIILRLEMIAKLFSSLNINKNVEKGERKMQPILLILERTMPLLKNICTLWIQNETVTESLFKALQQALTNIMDDIKPLINDICSLIMMIFDNKCVPSTVAIEIAGNFILMFYNDQQCRSIMAHLFVEIMKYNFTKIEESQDKLSDISDLLEVFYMFNTRITKKIPIIYVDVNIDCDRLVKYAIACIALPETGPMKKGISFLTIFVKESRNYEVMTNCVLSNGDKIIRMALMCIGGITPRTQVDVFADIFLSLNFKYPSEFLVWMNILQTNNFPSGFISRANKDSFYKKIVKEKVNKRLVQDHIRKFAAQCRNIAE